MLTGYSKEKDLLFVILTIILVINEGDCLGLISLVLTFTKNSFSIATGLNRWQHYPKKKPVSEFNF